MSSFGDENNFSVSNTAEQVSTPPAVSGSTDGLPPRHEGRKNRSDVWDHFVRVDIDGTKKARCKYCNNVLLCNGTSTLRAHTSRCKSNPNKRQRTTSSATASDSNVSSPSFPRYDPDHCRSELIKLFVEAELPFRLVDHNAFKRYSKALQPRFDVPSRSTLARNIVALWEIEKGSLKQFLLQHCRGVCLTTDTWTSCQNTSYLCLTGHFIDNNWTLQKKILNFCYLDSHTGEVMADVIELCLNEWGLNRVFSVTLDNASLNDTMIQHLKKRLMSLNNLAMNGEHIHIRCCAHILNLIVKEGLKEIDDSILRIRAAVRYVRSSPARLAKFMSCVERHNIEYKGHLCLDVETRWNSTYLMLDAALKLQKAFDDLEFRDTRYCNELNKGKGVPSTDDWDYVKSILPFLSIFYEATLRISGTSYVTSNIYMLEVVAIWNGICHVLKSSEEGSSTHDMATKMKKKYEKYWGAPDKLNMLLLIAVVLDPRYKMGYMSFAIDELFDSDTAKELKLKLESSLKSLFDEYGTKEGTQDNSQQSQSNIQDYQTDPYGWNRYLNLAGHTSKTKSKLQKYLEEEPDTNKNLNVLDWWKANSMRFPILANMAREFLAVPVSTVASESAFSTGGRMLDPYRTSLAPKKVEAIICTQDWLKETPFSLFDYDFEEAKNFTQEMVAQPEVSSSTVFPLAKD